MARPIRVEFPGALYHVTDRGVDRQDIFFNDEDRKAFLERLRDAHRRYGVVIHGYCLMTNHYHLEIETPEGKLSQPMQWLNQSYASHVNRRYKRVGPLFQGRFKAVVAESRAYLRLLTRYIHLNPVRAGMVSRPGEHPWSSYRAYLGLRKCPDWLETARTLSRFGQGMSERRRNYKKFVEEDSTVEDPLAGLAYGAILGTQEFVEWVRKKLKLRPDDGEVTHLRLAKPRTSLARISEVVGDDYGVRSLERSSRGRTGNEARNAAIYLARERSALPLKEIGKFFGGVGVAAVSLAHRRMAERMAKDRVLRRRIESISSSLDE